MKKLLDVEVVVCATNGFRVLFNYDFAAITDN